MLEESLTTKLTAMDSPGKGYSGEWEVLTMLSWAAIEGESKRNTMASMIKMEVMFCNILFKPRTSQPFVYFLREPGCRYLPCTPVPYYALFVYDYDGGDITDLVFICYTISVPGKGPIVTVLGPV